MKPKHQPSMASSIKTGRLAPSLSALGGVLTCFYRLPEGLAPLRKTVLGGGHSNPRRGGFGIWGGTGHEGALAADDLYKVMLTPST